MAVFNTHPGSTYSESSLGDFDSHAGPSSGTYDSWLFNSAGTYSFQGHIASGGPGDSIDQLHVTFGTGYYISGYGISVNSNIAGGVAGGEFTLEPKTFQAGDFRIQENLTNKPLTSIEAPSEALTLYIGGGVNVLDYTLTLNIGYRPPNQAPTNISLSDQSVSYSEGNNNVTVGTLSTTDANAGDSHTYSLVSGAGSTHNSLFAISGNSLQAHNPQTMAPGNYSVRIRTEDSGGLIYEEAVSITVIDDLAPEIQSITASAGAPGTIEYTVTFNESANNVSTDDFKLTTPGSAAGNISAVSGSGTSYTVTVNNLSGDGDLRLDLKAGTNISDNSGNQANAYSGGDSFYVDGTPPNITSPNISLSGASGINNEFIIGDTVTATWNATADGNSDVDTVTIDFSAFGGGTAVAATESGGKYTASYTIIAGTTDVTNAHVVINATDGAGNPGTGQSNDVSLDNQAPGIPLAASPLELPESAADNTSVGTATAASGDGLSYSLTNDAGGRFSIDTVTGEITYLGGGLDYETSPTLNIEVTTTDNAGNKASQSLNIAITNANEAPSVAPVADTGDYREGDASTRLWADHGIDPVDSGQSLKSIVLKVTGATDGSAEQLVSTNLSAPIELANGNQNLTANSHPLSVSVAASGPDFLITLESGSMPLTDWQNLLQTLGYHHTSEAPTPGARQVSIVSVEDTGASGETTTTGTFGTRTINVQPVNDSPDIAVNTGVDAFAGRTVTLTNTHLNEGDPDDDGDQVTYTLKTLPTLGSLFLNGVELATDDVFTQQDINDGLVTFRAARVAGDTSFDLTLSDGGEDSSTPATAQVSVSVRATPVVTPPAPDLAPGEVPLHFTGGNAIPVTTITLPSGVALEAWDNASAQGSNQERDLLGLVRSYAGDQLDSALNAARDLFTGDGDNLWVNAITLTREPGSDPGDPIRLNGQTSTGSYREALVIDARELGGGTINLSNIEFAIVIGDDLRFIGGKGNNTFFAVSGSQNIVLGEGDDELYGGDGDDVVGSRGGNDRLFGNSGNDTLFGGDGNDLMHGGIGHDVITVSGNRDDYVISQEHSIVTLQRNGNDDIDTILNAEILRFNDQDVALNYSNELSWIATLYDRFLQRQGDLDGVQYWAKQLEEKGDFADIIWGFMHSQEFAESQSTVIGQLSLTEQVELMYQTLLQRTADSEGLDYWVTKLESGTSLADVAASMAHSAEATGQYLDSEAWEFLM